MMKKESFKEHENYYLSRLIDGDKNAFNFIFRGFCIIPWIKMLNYPSISTKLS